MPVIGDRAEISLKKILFATDFSAGAQHATFYAAALAQRFQARVLLMHVIDLSTICATSGAGVSPGIFRRIGGESLTRIENDLASKNIEIKTILCESLDPVAEILKAVHESSAGLLVIGTRGHTGLARVVLGSTAEHLIHEAKCPILVIGPGVPECEEPVDLRRIVYATDFSPEAAKACVFALSFAQDFGAHLYLCHVLPRNCDRVSDQQLHLRFLGALQRLIPEGAKEWCEPECIVEHGLAADGIRLLAQRVNADLIVLGTRAASHWYDNLRDGVAFQVISGSNCPVLTIRG